MKKILIITPHLSTGGLPQFVVYKAKLGYEVVVFEYKNISDDYIIQREELKVICDYVDVPPQDMDSDARAMQLSNYIQTALPNIIHFEELPEAFMADQPDLLNKIFSRKLIETPYTLFCSTHGSNPQEIQYVPDRFIWPSDYCNTIYPELKTMATIWELPIVEHERGELKNGEGEKSIFLNILQVGLWFGHKNQKYSIELIKKLKEKGVNNIRMHFVGNNSGDTKEYWKPLFQEMNSDSTFIVHGELDAEKILLMYQSFDVLLHPSKMELNPLVPKEALGCKMPVLIPELKTLPSWYKKCDGISFLTMDIEKDADMLIQVLKLNDHSFEVPVISKDQDLVKIYEKTEALNDSIRETLTTLMKLTKSAKSQAKAVVEEPETEEVEFYPSFMNGAKLKIKGGRGIYNVRFIDSSNERILFNAYSKANACPETFINYFIPWRIEVWQKGKKIYSYNLSLKDKEVFISINSTSLGDNIAWIPYIAEFQRKHECKLRVSTFWNQLFSDNQYDNINFVDPEEQQTDLDAYYKVGVFDVDDRKLHPTHPSIIPLQRVAADRLGLPYSEIKPKIARLNKPQVSETPYVVICTESTAKAKEWQNKNGWQQVVNKLVECGYEVRVIQIRPTELIRINDRTGKASIHNRIKEISAAKAFIGLPSGLTWIAWALDVPVVMVSGFSEPFCEMTENENVIRVQNFEVCHGCWNNPEHKFEKSKNNQIPDWCPVHKGTPRQFECTKSITAEMVINALTKVISLVDGSK